MHVSRRLLHSMAWLATLAVVFALISQHFFDMQPCAWCVFQRLLVLLVSLVCWVSLAVSRRGLFWVQRLAGALVAITAIGGVISAAYQYKIASNLFSCDLTFADRFMVESRLDATLPWLFGIFATCADARVNLLGIEYALWALALFALLALGGLWAMFRPAR